MSGMLKIAIIGCGGISAFAHVPELINESDVEITALCDGKRSRAMKLKEKYKLEAKIYQKVDMMFDENPDISAVIIATYPISTAAIAKEIIKRGVHVLIQKPLMYHDGMKKELVQGKTKQQIMALPYVESLDIFRRIKESIAEEKLGQIQFVRIRTSIVGPEDYYDDVKKFYEETTRKSVYSKDVYADNRGCLSDMGVYSLSLYHYLFGEAKLESCALSGGKLEDSAVLILRPNKRQNNVPLIASIESGWNQANGIELVSVMGSKGFLCLTTDGKLSITAGSNSEIQEEAGRNSIKLLPISPYHAQAKWIQAILENPDSNQFEHTLERCVWVSKIIQDAYENRKK